MIFVLPVCLALLVVLRLFHVTRFGIDKIELKYLVIILVAAIAFSGYRIVTPGLGEKNAEKMIRAQASLFVEKTDSPLFLSTSPNATYKLANLNWNVSLDAQTTFSQQKVRDSSSPYFQPSKGMCDVWAHNSSSPNNADPDSFRCTQILSLGNGLEVYQFDTYDDIVGIYKDELLVFGHDINKESLDSLYVGSKSELLEVIQSTKFDANYDDKLNRWYSQTAHQRCLSNNESCPFGL